ncbi:MAG: spore maturation protein [Lachnospiraceae bacterium]|nr:spore maturation protein [Lachnospiraceae bacterium]
MKLIMEVSNLIIPLFILYILLFGMTKKVKVYDAFIKGAKDGLLIVYNLAPTLIGLLVGTGVLRESGALNGLANLLTPFGEFFKVPKEIIPLMVVKLFSGSAATGLLLDIYHTFGPDSYIGTLASILMSCTETVLYCMSVYFMSVNVSKTRWTLAGGLLSTLAGLIMSVVLATVMQ